MMNMVAAHSRRRHATLVQCLAEDALPTRRLTARIVARQDRISLQLAEKEAQAKAGALDSRRRGGDVTAEAAAMSRQMTNYEFSPAPTNWWTSCGR
jgi:hypothetical protein